MLCTCEPNYQLVCDVLLHFGSFARPISVARHYCWPAVTAMPSPSVKSNNKLLYLELAWQAQSNITIKKCSRTENPVRKLQSKRDRTA